MTENSKIDYAQVLADQFGGWWEEHPDYPAKDWQYEVANRNTRESYWQWVADQIENDTSHKETRKYLIGQYTTYAKYATIEASTEREALKLAEEKEAELFTGEQEFVPDPEYVTIDTSRKEPRKYLIGQYLTYVKYATIEADTEQEALRLAEEKEAELFTGEQEFVPYPDYITIEAGHE